MAHTVILQIDDDTYELNSEDYERLNKQNDLLICILLKRYQYYGYVKEGICLSANNIYDFIKKYKYTNETLEVFAGALNSNLPNYCSLFYDIEKYFGIGSFLTINISNFKYNILVSNPPYINSVMNASSEIILQLLKSTTNLLCIIVIPDWRSDKEYEQDIQVQLSSDEHIQDRQSTSYTNYTMVRQSPYFRHVLCIGDYKYHNYFKNTNKIIRDNTLIIILTNTIENDTKIALLLEWINLYI